MITARPAERAAGQAAAVGSHRPQPLARALLHALVDRRRPARSRRCAALDGGSAEPVRLLLVLPLPVRFALLPAPLGRPGRARSTPPPSSSSAITVGGGLRVQRLRRLRPALRRVCSAAGSPATSPSGARELRRRPRRRLRRARRRAACRPRSSSRWRASGSWPSSGADIDELQLRGAERAHDGCSMSRSPPSSSCSPTTTVFIVVAQNRASATRPSATMTIPTGHNSQAGLHAGHRDADRRRRLGRGAPLQAVAGAADGWAWSAASPS